jgi:streptogramin lyase
VWVASQGSSDLAIVDAESAERVRPSIDVGEGAAAIASGFDSVWVAKQGTGNLLRISVRSRQRRGDATALPAGDPVAVAAAEGAVWVGLRATPDGDGPGSVVKLDPRTGAIEQQLAVPGGLQDLAVGEDAVWVTNRGAATVTRIGIADGRRSTIRVGRRPAGIAVGEGAVWVAAMGDDALTRIDAGDRSTTTIALRDMPNRVAVGGGSVWVTARASGTLTRVDARTREVDGAPLRIGPRPFALDATRNTVWVGLVNDEAVRRVDF